MDRQRSAILICALVAVLAAALVFRVRVFVAGGKFLLAVIAIIAVAWVIWPRRGDR
jgi:hypothetical protein